MSAPSKSLTMIDPKQTKLIKLDGRNVYKNPSIDVVFDTKGNFYSNKRQKGFQLLNGRKVHYTLNLNGKIVKGNTTKKSLIKVLLGDTNVGATSTVNATVATKQTKASTSTPTKTQMRNVANKPIVKKAQRPSQKSIVDKIEMIEVELKALKNMIEAA